MRRHAPLLLIVLLPACAGIRPAPQAPVSLPPVETRVETPAAATQRRAEAPRPAYNLAGYPPPVREGYIDGCETARRSSYGRKDLKRFGEDPQYKMGWNDGFSICGKK